jgi:hypothetical protein
MVTLEINYFHHKLMEIRFINHLHSPVTHVSVKCLDYVTTRNRKKQEAKVEKMKQRLRRGWKAWPSSNRNCIQAFPIPSNSLLGLISLE